MKENKPFYVSLSDTQTSLKFCVRDFRYSLHENFSLELQVSGIEGTWNETAFSLKSFKPRVILINEKSVPYISNWDLLEPPFKVNGVPSQKWITIPEDLFNKSSDNKSPFSIAFKSNCEILITISF